MDTTLPKITVTIPDACQISGLCRSSIYECFKAGKLTPRKHGRRTLLLVSELQEYLESLPTANLSEAA